MSFFDENRCRDLLVIDNEPIRRQVELELQTVRAAIEECEKKISRHEILDLPAFRQWMAVECADLLREQRSIEDKIWQLRGRLAAIQGLTRHGIKHVGAAFYWFQEIEQQRAVVPPYVRRAWDEVTVGRPQQHSHNQKSHGVEVGRFEQDDEGDDIFAEASDGPSGGASREEDSGDLSESRPGESGVSGRIKSLFRKIALMLHPDMAGSVSRQELELWYHAQRAYEQNDVVALETVLARCDRVGTNCRTLSELREIVRQAGLRFLTLRESIAGLGKLPSWEFLLLSPFEVKKRLETVRRELVGVINELARDAAILQHELQKIETKANRWVQRRKGAEKQLALGI